jgi:hypothetical protein
MTDKSVFGTFTLAASLPGDRPSPDTPAMGGTPMTQSVTSTLVLSAAVFAAVVLESVALLYLRCREQGRMFGSARCCRFSVEAIAMMSAAALLPTVLAKEAPLGAAVAAGLATSPLLLATGRRTSAPDNTATKLLAKVGEALTGRLEDEMRSEKVHWVDQRADAAHAWTERQIQDAGHRYYEKLYTYVDGDAKRQQLLAATLKELDNAATRVAQSRGRTAVATRAEVDVMRNAVRRLVEYAYKWRYYRFECWTDPIPVPHP